MGGCGARAPCRGKSRVKSGAWVMSQMSAVRSFRNCIVGSRLAVAILIVAALFVPRGAAATGGPDLFGYSFTDSNELGGPTVDFENLAGIGTAVSLSDDQVSSAIAIPFSFSFYGVTYTNVFIS